MNANTARSTGPVMVAIAGFVFSVVIVGVGLYRTGWDPTLFVGFGEEAAATTEYAEERLGDVILRPVQGHDGKYFFVQANDPWVLDPENNASLLDHPVYRSQRMFYPLLAGGLGFFGPRTIVWALVLVNVVAMGFGTMAASRVAQRMGGSPWWGLAFVANVGLLFTLTNDDAGIVAVALAFWALAMLYEGRLWPAVALLSAATLTREVMIVCALGLGVWAWSDGRRRAALYMVAVPALSIAGWMLYLRAQLGPDGSSPNAIGWPFVGLVRAVPSWLEDPLVAAAGGAVILITILYLVRWAHTRSSMGWMFVGFIPLATLLTDKVWREIFDFTRAVAPLLTAAILLIFVEARRQREPLHVSTTGTGSGAPR